MEEARKDHCGEAPCRHVKQFRRCRDEGVTVSYRKQVLELPFSADAPANA
jgi:hypothetical protein